MNIIKSQYTSAQLLEHFYNEQEKVDSTIFEKVRRFKKTINLVLNLAWMGSLLSGILADKPHLILSSVGIGCLLILFSITDRYISYMCIEYYEKRGRYPFNHLTATMLPEYINNLEQCEKLLELQGKGKLSLLKKGDEQIILYTAEDGTEETFPLACPVKATGNTMDFSSHDDEIKDLLELKFWAEPKEKKHTKKEN